MKQIKGILFDFNGTLFFDSSMHVEAFDMTLDAYGTPRISRGELIKSVFGRTNARIFKDWFNPDATPEECERFSTVKKNFYFDACRKRASLRLAPGAEQMLDYLKSSNVPIALATGSDREEVDFFMEHLGISRWFNYGENIVYTDGTFNGKPAPDCYILAAKKLGLAPEECVVFEDGHSGILSARAANCAGVVVVHEEGIPSPVEDSGDVLGVYHGYENFREILASLGF